MKAITKTMTLILTQLVAIIATVVGLFWALIEFILYLVKDKEFNWLSVWLFVIGIIVAIISIGYLIYLEYRSRKINRRRTKFTKILREVMGKPKKN